MGIVLDKSTKAGLGYTMGNVLVKGISFLTLPLFSRIMTTEEFGIYNVFVSYEAILYVISGLAIHTSVRSAKLEFKERIDEYISSVALIYILNFVILSGIVLWFGENLGNWMGFDRPVLELLVMYSFGNAVLALYNGRISLDYLYRRYLAAAFLNSAGSIALSVVLIFTVCRANKETGRILGATVTAFLLALVILAVLLKTAKPVCTRMYWGFALKYSLPIVPHGISQVILAQFDRIMIRTLVGNAEAGIYSLAGNIKLILVIMTDSVAMAWSTWFYEQIERKEIKTIQSRANQLAMLSVICTVGCMAIAPELIGLLGGDAYAAGKYAAIPMILDAFVLFQYNLIVVAEYYRKKTVCIMWGTMMAAGINLVTNYIFITRFGFIAAAYTTLFSYTCYLAVHLAISRRLVGAFILPLGRLAFYAGITLASAGINLYFMQSVPMRWGVCAVLVLVLGSRLIQEAGVLEKRKKRGKEEDDQKGC